MFSNSPHPSSDRPITQADPGQRRDSTDSDVIHHLYFEDNDSFFPPSWLGKESEQRRPSNESTESKDSQDRERHAVHWAQNIFQPETECCGVWYVFRVRILGSLHVFLMPGLVYNIYTGSTPYSRRSPFSVDLGKGLCLHTAHEKTYIPYPLSPTISHQSKHILFSHAVSKLDRNSNRGLRCRSGLRYRSQVCMANPLPLPKWGTHDEAGGMWFAVTV
jgi:hypothetical protein